MTTKNVSSVLHAHIKRFLETIAIRAIGFWGDLYRTTGLWTILMLYKATEKFIEHPDRKWRMGLMSIHPYFNVDRPDVVVGWFMVNSVNAHLNGTLTDHTQDGWVTVLERMPPLPDSTELSATATVFDTPPTIPAIVAMIQKEYLPEIPEVPLHCMGLVYNLIAQIATAYKLVQFHVMPKTEDKGAVCSMRFDYVGYPQGTPANVIPAPHYKEPSQHIVVILNLTELVKIQHDWDLFNK